MDTACDAPPPAPCDDFAEWAQIAVKYADRPRPMPVLRFDRHGLTVGLDENAEPPAFGLPRRALIVAGPVALCELRLVARSTAQAEGHPTQVTLEPSRADDHAVLWQALREHRHHVGGAPLSAPFSRSPRQKPTDFVPPQPSEGTPKRESSAAPASGYDGCGRTWCDVAFTATNHDDAWFFSHWLDYYFPEVCARARMNDAAADLREVYTRVADHEVEVRFVFHCAERVARAGAEASSRWIAVEAARQLDMAVEYWLGSTASACAAPNGWPRRALLTSRAAGHSFSSK